MINRRGGGGGGDGNIHARIFVNIRGNGLRSTRVLGKKIIKIDMI